jgi:protoheme IX farnesyltransferase
MFKAYYQLTKPGIIRANVITAVAAFFLASEGVIDTATLLGLIIGTTLVVASGCVFNNYLDRKIDKHMKRTKNRALVTGVIKPVQALRFGWMLLIVGSGILVFLTNLLTALIGIIAVALYVYAYGYAKRHTHYATEVGTLPGAASILAGYTAVTGSLDLTAWLLFVVMVVWQLPHFLAITIFRSEEYAAAKLSVLPHRIGVEATQRRIMFGILGFGISTMVLGLIASLSIWYFMVMFALSMYWLYSALSGYQVTEQIKWARKVFGYSLIILLLFCILIAVDSWLS